jgi:hypothetical protein
MYFDIFLRHKTHLNKTDTSGIKTHFSVLKQYLDLSEHMTSIELRKIAYKMC